MLGSVDLPDVELAAVVLEQDVGAAVAVEVAGADGVPARPRIAEAAAADHARPVGLPDEDLAAGVLKQDVGIAVGVEIAGADRVPAGPRIAEPAAPITANPFSSQATTCPLLF